jgi:uncharacterized phage protein gp47/JayE
MAGLTTQGFIPLTYDEIKTNIEARLESFNPGFDFSPESPDGQMISIMGVLISQAWSELNLVYLSYNPNIANGNALRNIAQISGLGQERATASYAVVDLTGTAGVPVPAGSLVADGAGNEFSTQFSATIPASVEVLSVLYGPLEVPAGSIVDVVSVVGGWTGVSQPTDGVVGAYAMSEVKFRNLRNRTVLRNYTGVVDTIQARLLELGIEQVSITNNTSTTITLPDGTPPLTVQVTVGELGVVADDKIAKSILDTIGIGVPTYGTTTVLIDDTQGVEHSISFTKAVQVDISMQLDITFLSEEIGGAEEAIKADLTTHINQLLAGEDVIWSQLFCHITPYGEAQVNGTSGLLIQRNTDGFVNDNLVLSSTEFAAIDPADITITVT